jgi:hypothetical protein
LKPLVPSSVGRAPVAVGLVGADQHVLDAVAVEVPGADREAEAVPAIGAADLEAGRTGQAAGGDVAGEVADDRGVLAEQHIDGAGAAAVRVGARGADDDVIDAVVIDVAAGDRNADEVLGVFAAVDLEAVGPVERVQVPAGREARGRAEHDIDGALA